MMVQALMEQADNADKQKVSQKFAKQFNLASKALSALGANETVDDQVQAQIGRSWLVPAESQCRGSFKRVRF